MYWDFCAQGSDHAVLSYFGAGTAASLVLKYSDNSKGSAVDNPVGDPEIHGLDRLDDTHGIVWQKDGSNTKRILRLQRVLQV